MKYEKEKKLFNLSIVICYILIFSGTAFIVSSMIFNLIYCGAIVGFIFLTLGIIISVLMDPIARKLDRYETEINKSTNGAGI